MWSFVIIIVGIVSALDLLWWWCADRLLRPLPRARWWRIAWAAFVLAQFVALAWMMAGRFTRSFHWSEVPVSLLSLVLIWHLFILPAAVVLYVIAAMGAGALKAIAWGLRSSRSNPQPEPVTSPSETVADAPEPERRPLTRRELLGSAFAIAPPVIASVATGIAIPQLDSFRIRKIDVISSAVPRGLDGLTIAHVSDTHVGHFTSGRVLNEIADATNSLGADLVLFTGDLINNDIRVLDDANRMVRKMRARYGVYAIEGNHDLFQGREPFRSGVRSAGIDLLVNQETTLRINNERVQLLGIQWGSPRPGASRGDHRGDEAVRASMELLRPSLLADHFKILLAHHPHAFDPAIEMGIPLTLAGHTHGGQLMLGRHLGAGNLVGFRYMSGLYQQGPHALVVSNGVGNWFPLRVNAPAEIVHVTLRRA